MSPSAYQPKFCKMCRALLGFATLDENGDNYFQSINIGTISVAGVGNYCGEECRDADPDYRAAMDDAAEAATPRVKATR